MSTHDHQRRERSSTYFVQDRSNQEELDRLQLQDKMLTDAMGGVLPEQPYPTRFNRVLDVGCGTGGWLIELAKTYPTISVLVGVDVSDTIIEYARAQAEAEGVSDRVQFRTMDALLILDFPYEYFDLTNERLGLSYLRKWDWDKLLDEFRRITRPDGVIRITESDFWTANSDACKYHNHLFLQAFFHAGNFFSLERDAIIKNLPGLLKRCGVQNVQTRTHQLEFRADTPEGSLFCEDARRLYQTTLPFVRKWVRLPADHEKIYQQALEDMQQPGFVAEWTFLTVWGYAGMRNKTSNIE